MAVLCSSVGWWQPRNGLSSLVGCVLSFRAVEVSVWGQSFWTAHSSVVYKEHLCTAFFSTLGFFFQVSSFVLSIQGWKDGLLAWLYSIIVFQMPCAFLAFLTSAKMEPFFYARPSPSVPRRPMSPPPPALLWGGFFPCDFHPAPVDCLTPPLGLFPDCQTILFPMEQKSLMGYFLNYSLCSKYFVNLWGFSTAALISINVFINSLSSLDKRQYRNDLLSVSSAISYLPCKTGQQNQVVYFSCKQSERLIRFLGKELQGIKFSREFSNYRIRLDNWKYLRGKYFRIPNNIKLETVYCLEIKSFAPRKYIMEVHLLKILLKTFCISCDKKPIWTISVISWVEVNKKDFLCFLLPRFLKIFVSAISWSFRCYSLYGR